MSHFFLDKKFTFENGIRGQGGKLLNSFPDFLAAKFSSCGKKSLRNNGRGAILVLNKKVFNHSAHVKNKIIINITRFGSNKKKVSYECYKNIL